MKTREQDLGFAASANAHLGYCPQWTFQRCDSTTSGPEIDIPLSSDELAMGYRAIGTSISGLPDGVEALALSRNPEHSCMPHYRFVADARSDGGTIERIDCWVLAHACSDAMLWNHQHGRPLRVSVNLSLASLVHGDIAHEIRRTLRRTGMPPNWLNIDIDIAAPAEPGTRTVALTGIEWLGISLLALSNRYLMHVDESSAAHLTVESAMSGVHGPSDSIGPPRCWRSHQ